MVIDAKSILVAIIVSAGIPTAITSFLSWLIKKKIDDQEKRRAEKEMIREQSQTLLLKSVRAAISLGEATATALKNGKCNGETEAALRYATEIKHEQDDFLTDIAAKSIV